MKNIKIIIKLIFVFVLLLIIISLLGKIIYSRGIR